MTNYEPVQSTAIQLFNSIIEFHKGATSTPEEIAKIKAKYMLECILLTDAACVEILNSNTESTSPFFNLYLFNEVSFFVINI